MRSFLWFIIVAESVTDVFRLMNICVGDDDRAVNLARSADIVVSVVVIAWAAVLLNNPGH